MSVPIPSCEVDRLDHESLHRPQFFNSLLGNISLGSINHSSLTYTGVANDEHNMLVALVLRPRESPHQLLDRPEQALGPAVDDQFFIDEING
jgi:hypothetical protein